MLRYFDYYKLQLHFVHSTLSFGCERERYSEQERTRDTHKYFLSIDPKIPKMPTTRLTLSLPLCHSLLALDNDEREKNIFHNKFESKLKVKKKKVQFFCYQYAQIHARKSKCKKKK